MVTRVHANVSCVKKKEKSRYFIPFEESVVVFITALGTERFLVVVFVHFFLQGDIFCYIEVHNFILDDY